MLIGTVDTKTKFCNDAVAPLYLQQVDGVAAAASL
jgi:hypothetical protein